MTCVIRNGAEAIGPVLCVFLEGKNKLIDGFVKACTVRRNRSTWQHDRPPATFCDCHGLWYVARTCQGMAKTFGVNDGNPRVSALDSGWSAAFSGIEQCFEILASVRIRLICAGGHLVSPLLNVL